MTCLGNTLRNIIRTIGILRDRPKVLTLDQSLVNRIEDTPQHVGEVEYQVPHDDQTVEHSHPFVCVNLLVYLIQESVDL